MSKSFTHKMQSLPIEIAPGLWSGLYSALESAYSAFPNLQNIKVIINCDSTAPFLHFLASPQCSLLSSDVLALSFDPHFTPLEESADLERDFARRFSRILRNYVDSFYRFNPNANQLIHDSPDSLVGALSLPILTGNIKASLFGLVRLTKLMMQINPSLQVLLVSSSGADTRATALACSYVIDSYNISASAALDFIAKKNPSLPSFNANYYSDLIMVEALRQFQRENTVVKTTHQPILTRNAELKRRQEPEEGVFQPVLTAPLHYKRKRRFP